MKRLKLRCWGQTVELRLQFFSVCFVTFLLVWVSLRKSTWSAVTHTSSALVPLPLSIGAKLREGAHVLPRDQRIASRLGIPVKSALNCQALSSVGTRGWSDDEWVSAVGAASAYRHQRDAIIVNMSKLPLGSPNDWYDLMPVMHSCGGRDPDAPPHDAALQRFAGDGDGGKWLCSLAELEAPCLIYSLGSYGDFKFEEALTFATECELWSFDCTVSQSEKGFGSAVLAAPMSEPESQPTLREPVMGSEFLDSFQMDNILWIHT